jgi:catechol 2,3-dioxygenase-like lactoylglutathione lyase family enzyme
VGAAPPVALSAIIVAVNDLPRAVAFYRAVTGWEPRIEAPVFVELAGPQGVGLGLYLRRGFALNTGVAAAEAPADGTTGTELYLHVADLDAAVARCQAAGARPLSPRAVRAWGDEAAYFADPDGNVVVVARPHDR